VAAGARVDEVGRVGVPLHRAPRDFGLHGDPSGLRVVADVLHADRPVAGGRIVEAVGPAVLGDAGGDGRGGPRAELVGAEVDLRARRPEADHEEEQADRGDDGREADEDCAA
jgi:hypothetical protein